MFRVFKKIAFRIVCPNTAMLTCAVLIGLIIVILTIIAGIV